MTIFVNPGLRMSAQTREAMREAGFGILKRRKKQNCGYPVLNYGNLETVITAPEVFNRPEFIHQTSQGTASKLLGDLAPKSWRTLAEAELPFIAKIPGGMKGKGKIVVTTEEERKKAAQSKYHFSLFQQFLEPPRKEYRAIVIRGKVVIVYVKYLEDEMDPTCEKQFKQTNVNGGLSKCKSDVYEISKQAFEKFNLDMIGFDLIRDKNKKLYVIEANSSPGMCKVTANRVMQELSLYI